MCTLLLTASGAMLATHKYRNEDDFIDSMGGSESDLIDLVRSSETISDFVQALPYEVDPTGEAVARFFRKHKNRILRESSEGARKHQQQGEQQHG